MVFSVFAGTVAISGTAVGNVSSFQSSDASDVTADESNARQTVTFSATADGTGTDTISINAPTGLSTEVIDSSVSGFDGASIDSASPSEVVVSGLDSSGTYTVTLALEHDTTGVDADPDTDYSYTFTSEDGTASTDATFNIVSETDRVIINGDTLFQGEGDYQLADSSLSPGDLERTSGDSAGVVLEDPVPEDAPTGSYADADPANFEVTVQTPRVSDLEIQNQNEEDIAGGIISANADTATVVADFNYEASEALELTVEDETGLEVTQQALDGGSSTGSSSPATFDLNLNQLESGEEYTVTVEGEDDLDFGSATRSTTFEISSDDTATLNLDQDEATQGEDVRYEITGADEGDVHPVVISGNDVVDGGDVTQIFRNVGDTVDVGETGAFLDDTDAGNGDAIALVEIDDGVGVGQIETADLDDSSIDVTLYESVGTDDITQLAGDGSDIDSDVEADDQTLDVTEGYIQRDNPTGS
jgi:hypothetical protein